MRNLIDTHNHCEFSFDGKRTTAHRSAQSAFDKGLDGIVFTDHYDIYIPEVLGETVPRPQDFDIKAQQTEIERVDGLFPESFKVLKGIEIGMNQHSLEEARILISSHSFDQVIASVHYLDDSDPYYGAYFNGRDFKQAYGLYLETIFREMILLQDFDIAGHFDYVARYAPYPQDSIKYRDFSDIFDSLFRFLIENGKGLELNTKSCAGGRRGRQVVRDHNVLLRYKELGGEIISLGSDSHSPAHVAEGFRYHADLLRSLGFRWSSHYEKRQLVQLPL